MNSNYSWISGIVVNFVPLFINGLMYLNFPCLLNISYIEIFLANKLSSRFPKPPSNTDLTISNCCLIPGVENESTEPR